MPDYPYYEVVGDSSSGGVSVQFTVEEDGANVDDADVVDAVRGVLAAAPGVTGTRAYRVTVTSAQL